MGDEQVGRRESVIDQQGVFTLLATHVADAETQWSLGTFGAIAEFSRDADEPVTSWHMDASMSAVTARGGIRIAPMADMRPIASETTTRESWSHRVALCLPIDQCAMGQRAVFTELGPDGGVQVGRRCQMTWLGAETSERERYHEPHVYFVRAGRRGFVICRLIARVGGGASD
jgi:hypothetical protein